MRLDPEGIPNVSPTDAVKLAHNAYGIDATCEPLPSERDQNFFLTEPSGRRFVLKVANAFEEQDVLEAQNAAMEHVHQQGGGLGSPTVCQTSSGSRITTLVGHIGRTHLVRMLTFVPGDLLAAVRPHSPKLLESLGAFFGRLDRALENFSHPGTRRYLQWDLNYGAATVRSYLPNIEESDGRALVERQLDRFETVVAPASTRLRVSVIHNDGNDHNVLVGSPGSPNEAVSGVIDFGDIVETCTVFELAVAAAYALLDKQDPIAAAVHVTRGYHATNDLTDAELDVLFDLIVMRLCMSVSISAYQSKQNPGNEYLVISQRPAWDALNNLALVDPNEARDRFHEVRRELP